MAGKLQASDTITSNDSSKGNRVRFIDGYLDEILGLAFSTPTHQTIPS
jgi:hypothetical protein